VYGQESIDVSGLSSTYELSYRPTVSVPLNSGLSVDPAVNTRRVNRQRLLDAIRRHGPISRADLAKRTALSPPTVSGLVEELVADVGLLREVGIGASSGGRPPVLLEFNADYGYLAGVDIGSRMLRVAVSDLQGRVMERREERTRAESCEATIQQVCALVSAAIKDAGRDPAKLFAVGIGAPGMTDVNAGRVISATNLVGWTDVPLRDLVQERLAAPVRVDNDANMAALGERWMGVARSASHFVFLALGAGVGAGVMIDGRLHRGHHWYAGEICRMTLDYRDWQVDYGERGYLESHISATAIPDWAHVRPLVERAGSDREAAMRTIFESARRGDAEALAVVEEMAVYLGTAVANIVAVLDPSLIVFGGGLSHAGDVLLEPVRRVLSKIVPNVPTLATSALGDDAQLMGSVYSAMELAEARVAAIACSARRA
jgi:glucokinase